LSVNAAAPPFNCTHLGRAGCPDIDADALNEPLHHM
jgi:hypothetical protein